MDLPIVCRLLFIGLWNYCDDYGRMPFAPRTIKAQLFPEDDVSGKDIEQMLYQLSSKGMIVIYSAEDKDFLAITNWDRHQKIDNKAKPKFPDPYGENSKPRDESEVLARNIEGSIGIALEGKGKGREKEGKNAEASPSAHEVSPSDPQKRYFDRSIEVLGANRRGLAAKLLKSKSGVVSLAMSAIEAASGKSNPAEYIGAIIAKNGSDPPNGRPDLSW